VFEYENEITTINYNQSGPVASRLFKTLTDIQYGLAEDPYGWTLQIKVN
jgi:branched-chain amino acid aminotransferase